jgi:hypothetical protein
MAAYDVTTSSTWAWTQRPRGPKFCSMKLSHVVRDAALAAKAAKFRESGGDLYRRVESGPLHARARSDSHRA